MSPPSTVSNQKKLKLDEAEYVRFEFEDEGGSTKKGMIRLDREKDNEQR
jgi:hypothetical protein